MDISNDNRTHVVCLLFDKSPTAAQKQHKSSHESTSYVGYTLFRMRALGSIFDFKSIPRSLALAQSPRTSSCNGCNSSVSSLAHSTSMP